MARSRRDAGRMLEDPQDENGQPSVWADYGTRKSRNKENESRPARCVCGDIAVLRPCCTTKGESVTAKENTGFPIGGCRNLSLS